MEHVRALEQSMNPYPHYEAMRETAPVFHDEQTGMWQVFKYDDVHRVLSEHATFSSQRPDDDQSETGRLFAASLINTDPPRHRQLRSLVSQAFTPKAVDALAPRIAEITEELLDAFAPAGTADLVKELAYPLPVIVIAELMGIPAEDRDRFKLWSDAIVSTVTGDQGESGHALHGEMIEYFLSMIEQRRRTPGHDLISALLAAEIDGQQLTVPELLGFCALLLVAGNETTTNLIGNAVLTFTEHPGTVERLLAEPELLPHAIEEVLRYRSPVQAMYRAAAAETMLGDQSIPAGSVLIAWIGSANRDPRQFERAEEYDVDRPPFHHLAFGQGVHFCLGAPLARLEARIALQAVLARLPGISVLAEPPLERVDSTIVFGPKQLPVTWQQA